MSNSLVRLVLIKDDIEYNVLFDRKFTIEENLKLLGTITGDNFDNCYVYDEKLKLFLDKTISIDKYNMPSSRTFYIY